MAEHPIESLGVIHMACSLEGFTRNQLVWYNVVEGMRIISDGELNDSQAAAQIKN